jgi:hypothetical protein
MRLLTAICITAIVVAFAVPALAETQNIKVSGDLKIASVVDNHIDYAKKNVAKDNHNFFMQQVGLNVAADLTDNVSTYVRLLNERAWDAENQGEAEFSVLLDEGYVTLKEMLYAPLTLKLGRQNIWLGKGLIIGNAGALVWDKNGGIPNTSNELSEMTAFDAMRATLDYDPWTVDLIYAMIDENGAADALNNDVNLYGGNIGYKFSKYDAEAEVYDFLKWDRTDANKGTAAAPHYGPNYINTLGVRGSLVPVDNLSLWGELAYQAGKYRTTTRKSRRQAYAFDVGGDYTFADVKWTPKVGLEYTYLSGDNRSTTGEWKAWDPVYRGKFDNYLLDFRNITKVTTYDNANAVSANSNNSGTTNLNELAVFGSIKPMTDISIDARYTYEWFDETPLAGKSDKLGQEIDGKVTYDYTEDVSFAIAGGYVTPGAYYPTDFDSGAGQVITTVSVDF